MPSREITLDERIVKHIGRVSFLQYIRNKPNQYGIKIYVVADAHNGFVVIGRFIQEEMLREEIDDNETMMEKGNKFQKEALFIQ